MAFIASGGGGSSYLFPPAETDADYPSPEPKRPSSLSPAFASHIKTPCRYNSSPCESPLSDFFSDEDFNSPVQVSSRRRQFSFGNTLHPTDCRSFGYSPSPSIAEITENGRRRRSLRFSFDSPFGNSPPSFPTFTGDSQQSSRPMHIRKLTPTIRVIESARDGEKGSFDYSIDTTNNSLSRFQLSPIVVSPIHHTDTSTSCYTPPACLRKSYPFSTPSTQSQGIKPLGFLSVDSTSSTNSSNSSSTMTGDESSSFTNSHTNTTLHDENSAVDFSVLAPEPSAFDDDSMRIDESQSCLLWSSMADASLSSNLSNGSTSSNVNNTSLSRPLPRPPPAPRRKTPMLSKKNSLWEAKLLFDYNRTSAPRPFCYAEEFDIHSSIVLGQGCFFKVFKVINRRDGKPYAIKRSLQMFRGRGDRANYLREIQSLTMLGPSPHIIKLYRAWQEEGYFHVQMDYCPYNFREYIIATSPLIDDSFLSKCIFHISQGLFKVHEGNVVHLDIKPENILIGLDGCLKLSDFGTAILNTAWEDGAEGDAVYIAPECLDEKLGIPGPPADIFSFGLVLFSLVTQSPLPKMGKLWREIRGEGEVEGTNKYIEKYLSSCNSISLELRELIVSMLSRNPIQRPTAGQLISIVVAKNGNNNR